MDSNVETEQSGPLVSDVFDSVNSFKNWQIELIVDKDIDSSITHDEVETVKRLLNAAQANIEAKHTVIHKHYRIQGKKEKSGNTSAFHELIDISQKPWVEMLMTIQGVSEIKALGIVVEYPSLSHLMEAYRN